MGKQKSFWTSNDRDKEAKEGEKWRRSKTKFPADWDNSQRYWTFRIWFIRRNCQTIEGVIKRESKKDKVCSVLNRYLSKWRSKNSSRSVPKMRSKQKMCSKGGKRGRGRKERRRERQVFSKHQIFKLIFVCEVMTNFKMFRSGLQCLMLTIFFWVWIKN